MQNLKLFIFCILYLVDCISCEIDPKDRLEPPPGQRCSGRNYQGRRCCTPENPCDEGEGDCDGPGDGGQHDGHRGCKGDLVCGSNNCKQFGIYFHEKDDCCVKPTNGVSLSPDSVNFIPGVPAEPPAGEFSKIIGHFFQLQASSVTNLVVQINFPQ